MVVREACPACGSERFKRNGHLQTGQQNHQCKACGRQFVLHADNRVISDEQRTLVERLLCEKISLHGICRAVGVSIRWLMGFMAARFAALPDHLHVLPVAAPREVIIGRLEVEADEMWGSVIQVMLCPRSYGIVGRNTNVIREAAERYGRERSVSSMWFEAIQAKWSSANWTAESSMQDVWSPICPPGGQSGD